MTARYGKEEKREERCQQGGDEGAGWWERRQHKRKEQKEERDVRNICREEEAAPASRCAAGESGKMNLVQPSGSAAVKVSPAETILVFRI